MSYGWLTESALLPKKSKPIKIDDEGGCFALKAVLQRQKQKTKSNPIPTRKDKQSTNKGVEERMKKDQVKDLKFDASNRDMTLQRKQKTYLELQQRKRNVNQLLVNFQDKQFDDKDNEEYEKEREEFYAGRLKDLQNNREEEEQNNYHDDFRENAAWQRQVLEELKGKEEQEEKVKQVFDRKMKESQKEALTQVRREIKEEEKIREEARRRRQDIKMQRTLKIKRIQDLAQQQNQKEKEQGEEEKEIKQKQEE